jgi:DNA-binding transcriptional MerR regulator
VSTPALRIGAVARRTGVAVATLRAWERRYDLLLPGRTEGGHRLYSEQDVARVLAVLRLTAQGWSVSAAAAAVTAGPAPARLELVATPDPDTRDRESATDRVPAPAVSRSRTALDDAIRTFDGDGADAALDESFARLGVAYTLEDVVMPVLRDLGTGWEEDPFLIAAEHFATNTLRPRLHRILQGVQRTSAPTCVAAAPEGEDHELGVLAAGAVAADEGFRVTYLGARTPSSALERSIATLRPDVVLVGAMTSAAAANFVAVPPALSGAQLVVGGPGFDRIEAAALPAGTRRAGSLVELPATLREALTRAGAVG